MVTSILIGGVTVFEKDYWRLVELYEALESSKDPVISSAVLEILETWLDLLINFPEEVLALDLISLKEYMSDRSENFYKRYSDKEKTIQVKILFDSKYMYKVSSVVLFKENLKLYYPYSLVIACNYPQAVSSFCSAFEKTDMTLVSLVNVIYTILKSGEPFLFDADIDLMTKLLALDIQGGIPVSELLDEHVRTGEYYRLSCLQVFQLYYVVNFPALGLVPYMNISTPYEQITEGYKRFIEHEFIAPEPFRVLLFPIEREEELLRDIDENNTCKVIKWYNRYDLQYLERGITDYWTWSRGLTTTSGPVSARVFKLVDFNVPEVSFTPVHSTILDIVHRSMTIPPVEIANVTGIKKRTVYNYFKRAIEMGVIIPYWSLTRTGLDEYFRVVLAEEPLEAEVKAYLERFPKTNTNLGNKFTSTVLYLPSGMVKKVEDYLKTSEQEEKCRILSIGTFTADSWTVNRGFELKLYLDEKKRVKKKRKSRNRIRSADM
ncbi:MAG: hypothetical protein ACXAEU_18125 [Candidatus Hodarchaeales archaeon]|jgi:hypothetical protein